MKESLNFDNILSNLLPITDINYDVARQIFQYYLNNRDNILFTRPFLDEYCECAKVLSLFDNDIVLKLLLQYCFDKKVLLYLVSIKPDLITILLLNKMLLQRYDIDDYYLKDIIASCNQLPQLLFDNKLFIQKIARIKDPTLYLQIIKILENNIDINNIRQYREKNVLKKELYQGLSKNALLEYVAIYFFEDYYSNVVMNIEELMHFVSLKPLHIIDKENLLFYKAFIDLIHLSNDDIINFLSHNYSNGNKIAAFYDDLRKVKDVSYQDLVNNSFHLEKSTQNASLSKQYGINVYYLDGQDFYAFVRCLNIEKKNQLSVLDNYIYSNFDYSYCFSYIGSHNINTIRNPRKYVTFLYGSINYQHIVWVNHADLFSISLRNNKYLSFKENELHTSRSLVDHTTQYNEVIVKNDGGIIPSALLCFDHIIFEDIAMSKKYSLPIVLVNSLKYQKKDFKDNNSKIYTL